ncbi:MAG: ClpX C4-type zinc finger protein [Methylocella sp.]
MTEKHYCIFCRRSQDETKRILAGPGIAICDECTAESMAIIAEEDAEWRDAQIERLTKMRDSAAPQSK